MKMTSNMKEIKDVIVEDLRNEQTVSADFKVTYNKKFSLLFEKIEGNEASLIGYEGQASNIVIPREVGGNTVTEIGDKAFQACKMSKVKIPNTVKRIGEDAFNYCTYLVSIKVPSSVKSIARFVFADCWSMESVNMSNSITSINLSAFLNCFSLREIKIPDSVKKIDMFPMAVSSCRNLSSIVVSKKNKYFDSRNNCNAIIETKSNTLLVGCDKTIIPDTVTTICTEAFHLLKTTGVIIPNYVQEIKEYAFSRCLNLQKIFISKSVEMVDYNSFSGCRNLSSIHVHPDNKIFDSRQNCNAIIRTDNNELVFGCKTTIIPDSVKIIGDYAFHGVSFDKITIPNSVKIIGWGAFWDCFNLKNVVISNSVTEISRYAFEECTSLMSVSIPKGVVEIGYSAFKGCTSLMSVSIPSTTEKISENSFEGCERLRFIVVDRRNKFYDSRNNCNAIIETKTNTLVLGCCQTIIPGSVSIIGAMAFSNCPCLKSIVIPNSVESIEEGAFMDCRNLEEVVLSSKLKRIGKSAFSGCSSLTTIEIPSSVTEIDRSAFIRCVSLKRIIVGKSSLSLCHSLRIPKRVEIIVG